MRHNLLTKILVLVLALLVLIPNMGLGVFAADDGPTNEGGSDTPTESFDVSGSKKASPNLLIGEDRETTVTLSLPSAEYKNQIDIVFTMDSSTSTLSGTAFAESAMNLFKSILEKNPGVELKIGVVRFRGRAYDALDYLSDGANKGLVVYSDDTKDLIEKALSMTEAEVKAAFGNGSNTHAGAVVANELLEADEEVDDSNKYVILLTDGKSYIWYNEKNEPTTIYSQWYRRGGSPVWYQIQKSGKPELNQSTGYNKYSYSTDVLDRTNKSNIFVFSSFEDLYNSTSKELTKPTKWDQFCYYADDKNKVPSNSGSIISHPTTNGAELFTSDLERDFRNYYEYVPEGDWVGVPYLEANPYEIIDNKDGTYTFDTNNINPDYYQYHVDALQKGAYIAAHYWADMVDTYNCAAVTYLSGTDNAVTGVAIPFSAWLRENSDYGAEANNETAITAMFEGIDNDIRYMVSTGVVTDVIKDNFDLANPNTANAFRMTYNKEELTASFADGVWSFDDGNYTVTYNTDSKTITWTINVPIENLKPITLSYDLLLTDESAKTSSIYDTNDSAELVYKSTDGKKDGKFTFEVPQVAYIKLIDIDVEKVWDDHDDQDGIRPNEITVQLVGGKEPVDGELTEEGQWKFTFRGVPDSTVDDEENPTKLTEIKYTIVEEGVDGYTSGKPEGSVEKGFTITNTHEPEFSFFIAKIWDDEQDADGIRPESVTVNLLANGEPIDEAELGDFNMWTASYTVPFYDADGEPIEYTVTEEPVEGYEKPVIVFDPDYSVYLVTNKHEVKEPPKTDDATNQWFWAGMMFSSMALIAVIFYLKRKQDEE